MGIRRKKHNYEKGKKKSVISKQIVQNEYLIRIIHRIRDDGFTNSNTETGRTYGARKGNQAQQHR